jgi:SWI/SNF-related matrix-associated actin-dependent regulator of chromatin subfamily A member 5
VLTPEEEEEKQMLLDEGFSEWTKRDLHAFLRLCEQHGRNNPQKIADGFPNKPAEEVLRYHTVFWERYKEIEGHERMLKTIAKGEEKLARASEIQEYIAQKLGQYENPMESLELKYTTQQKGKGFTVENDRFLVCQANKVGYGDWDQLHYVIRNDPRFTFDYFFKSRTPTELGRRLEVLVRQMEKEDEKKSGVPQSRSRRPSNAKAANKGDVEMMDEAEQTGEMEEDEVPVKKQRTKK